ncbi:MAG: phospho-N-acetylmuramoyl-pentapeptide-transferase [Clostridiales Family XIII bacterium]|jgi:phospho-N-acetylmuramoyl-pentapeptide-transferase|nr:phospho-N-acetylmuramoyl-pentapeptide-transferase [Clostridiales Family XIII bacterium]
MIKDGMNLTMNILAPLIVAMVVTNIVVRHLIPYLKKIKSTQQIYEDAPDSHQIKAGTPTMGGVGIILGVLIGTVFAMGIIKVSMNLIVVLIVFVLFGAVGFLDDYTKVAKRRNLGLTAKQKIVFQLIVSIGVALYYVFFSGCGTQIVIPFIWKTVELGYWIIPYIVFIMVAMTNSVNLTDGLDGLAAGVTTVMSLFWPVIATFGVMLTRGVISGASDSDAITNYTIDAFFFSALAGACLGFLAYNRYPAKIFMGDTGSLAIGGGIAAAALFTKMELFLPVVGLIFGLEALSDIIQVASYKLRNGKRVFKMAPLHHHFELSGWREQKVVAVFVGVTIILCVITVVIIAVQGHYADAQRVAPVFSAAQ